MRVSWLMACVLGLAPAAHADPLSFPDAVAAARAAPNVEAGVAAVRAAERAIGPAAQLPDPELVFGLQNVPVEGPDAYRLNRDEMTMQTVGVMQEVPSGSERRALRAMAEADAARAGAALEVARLEARMGAAEAWIDLHFAERRVAVIDRLAVEADALSAAARARLSGGAGSADAAISAEVEAARMQDRRADLAAARTRARAALRRWIGEAADKPLAVSAPQFVINPGHLRAELNRHPELAAFAAADRAAEAGLKIARAERAPDWSWSVMYGRRSPAFDDMASVEVRIGLPLFQPWRQGPLVAARRADVERASAERRAAEREHAALLEGQLAEFQAVSANLSRAREVRLPLARRRAEAAAGAFAASTASSADLIAARRDALEAELDVIDLEQRQAALGAALTLQHGEVLQ